MSRMALYWGVRPLHFTRLGSTDEMIAFAESKLLELGLCRPGEAVVMLAGVPPNERHSTNLMKLHRIRG
jgi:pyruvate kinase